MTHQAETSTPDNSEFERLNFVERIVADDLGAGRVEQVHTRFPPEPNGFLHIGHAKAICVDFGIAESIGGVCNLRFDDTNPGKESVEYVEAIKDDIRWLGFDWGDRLFFASDWFEDLYGFGEELVQKGLAYVCDLSAEETREYRGTVTEVGKNSPYRERPPEENLGLLRRMRAGEFEDGACTLKAKIDMASPNMNMRDPVLYRILRTHHHRTGNDWCIYPMYDFTHGQCDALEQITHSLCSLEFENHRLLYDWFTTNLSVPMVPHQYEFARLKLTYTVVSKRKLVELVESGLRVKPYPCGGLAHTAIDSALLLREELGPVEAIDSIGVEVTDRTMDRIVFGVNGKHEAIDLKGMVDSESVQIFNAILDRSQSLEQFIGLLRAAEPAPVALV